MPTAEQKLKDELNKTLETQFSQAGTSTESEPSSEVINLEDIQNAPDVQIPDATPSPQMAVPSIEDIFGQFNQESDAERTQNEIVQSILSGTTTVQGEDALQQQADEKFGVTGLKQGVTDLEGELGILAQKFQAIPTDVAIESRGQLRSAAGAGSIIDARKTRAQADYLVGAAQLQAKMGSLEQAQRLSDQAVAAQVQPVKDQLERAKLAYDMNKDTLSRIDSKKAAALEVTLQERERIINNFENTQKTIQQLSVNASANGADQATIKAIQEAGSIEDAIAAGGKFAIDPQTVLAQKNFEENVKNTLFTQQLQLANLDQSRQQFNATFDQKQREIEAQEAVARGQQEQIATQARADQILKQKTIGNEIIGMTEKQQNAKNILASPYFSAAFGPNFASKGLVGSVGRAASSFLPGGDSITEGVSSGAKGVFGVVSGQVKDLRNSLDTITSDTGISGLEAFSGPTTDFEYGVALEAATRMRDDSSEKVIREELPKYYQAIERAKEIKAMEAQTAEQLVASYDYYLSN